METRDRSLRVSRAASGFAIYPVRTAATDPVMTTTRGLVGLIRGLADLQIAVLLALGLYSGGTSAVLLAMQWSMGGSDRRDGDALLVLG